MKVSMKGEMSKITLEIKGLHEILGQDYVIEKMGTIVLHRSNIHFSITFSFFKADIF